MRSKFDFLRDLMICLCFGLLISCSQSQSFRKIELISKRLIEIPLDDQTSPDWFFVQTIDLIGEEYLVFHDHIRSDPKFIYFSHITDSQKSFKTPLYLDGPNGIGHLDGFHIRNLDSIFVLNRYKYELNLVDSSGKVKDRFRLRKDNSNGPATHSTALPFIWSFAPVIDLGDKLIIPSIPEREPFESNYQNQTLTIELNLKTKSIEYRLGYTDRYFDSGFWGLQLEAPSYTVNYNDSVILQSFPIEDRLMVYDFKLNLLQSPSLFSNYYSNVFQSLPDLNRDPFVFYPHIYSNPKNNMLLYDHFRNLYYRIMTSSYPSKTIESWEKSGLFGEMGNNDYPNRMIMVFDRDFNEIGVIDIDQNQYWVDFIRIVKDGIIIQRQTKDENKCTFELFEIEF